MYELLMEAVDDVAEENDIVECEEVQMERTTVFAVKTKLLHYMLAPGSYHRDLAVSVCSTCLFLSVRSTFGTRVCELVSCWVVQTIWVFKTLQVPTLVSRTWLVTCHWFVLRNPSKGMV